MSAPELGGGEMLTVAEEVSSRAYYEKHYRAPERPGGHSGITFGIGYDIGQGKPEACRREMWDDWRGKIPDEMLHALEPACGVWGDAAQQLLPALRRKVEIPFDTAMAVFEQRDVPKWEARIRAAVPNTDKLAPDCLGSIFSLSYNRGASFTAAGDRYREMRAIRDHMAAGRFELIPGEFRAMKRLWNNGLCGRREREAQLFERGLKAAAIVKASPTPVAHDAPTVTAQLPPVPTQHQAAAAKAAAVTSKIADGGVVTSPAALLTGAPSHVLIYAAAGLVVAVVIGGIVYYVASRHRRIGKADPPLPSPVQ